MSPVFRVTYVLVSQTQKITMSRAILSIFFLFLVLRFSHAAMPQTESVTIQRVMDGDTFRLSNGQKLKLAGVNAPELHDTPKLPQEARRFNKEVWAFRSLADQAERLVQRLVKDANKEIWIESGTQGVDEQGNLIGYIYIPTSKLDPDVIVDGETVTEQNGRYQVFLNAYLLKVGLAELMSSTLDSKYQELFSRLEAEAKKNEKGLWS